MLGIGGWLSWQAIKGFVPWASPGFAYALAGLAVTGLLVFFGYHLGSEGKSAAVAERDLQWQQQYSEQNNELQKLRARARDAAGRVAPTPADRAERMRLCEQSPTCRDRRQ